MNPSGNKCFHIPRAVTHPSLRLFCFPPAGGGSSLYSSWADQICADIEINTVRYPGRERRFLDAVYRSLDNALNDLTQAIGQRLDAPFAFFGHSMGALLAFELIHAIKALHGIDSQHLFVSSCRAPWLAANDRLLSNLSDDELLAELQLIQGASIETPEQAQLFELLLPAIRADLSIFEHYQYVPRSTIPCPITAFGGTDDRDIATEDLIAWQDETCNKFRLQMFQGGHFYLRDNQRALLDHIQQPLVENLRRREIKK